MNALPGRVFLLGLAVIGLLVPAFSVRAQSQPLNPDRVTFYTEPNFKGDSLVVEAGASVANLDRMHRENARPWTFAISSVRIDGAAKATVYSAAEFRGDRLEITRSITDLYGERRSQQAGTTWDRSIVSIAVTGPQRVVMPSPAAPPTTVYVVPAPPPAPPPVVVAPPPPPRLSFREAEIIVQRAYREVLERSPGPEELRSYRDRLLRNGWSERQIIQSLQRSGEARSISADESIVRIYREEFGRDPDARELNYYRGKWRDSWTQGAIRESLRQSPEGRKNQNRVTIIHTYRDLIGREPDAETYARYEQMMRERGFGERQLREAIMRSEEYRGRGKR